MEEYIKSEIENMKEGERILFSIGLEIGLGLKTFEDIIKSCEKFNEVNFCKNISRAKCPHEKDNVIKYNRYGKNRLQKNEA